MSTSELSSHFQQVFNYHHDINQKVIASMAEHRESVTEEMITLISHMLNAHQIWNARITGDDPQTGVFEVHPIDKLKSQDHNNYLTTLQIIDDYKFDKVVEYKNSKGIAYRNNMREILFHISNHTSHHRGQLMRQFREQGIDPVLSDFIFYAR